MIKSLHWRLQLWHALILILVLVVFGGIIDYLQWQTRIQQVDAELDRATEILRNRMWRPGPPPFRRDRRRGGAPPENVTELIPRSDAPPILFASQQESRSPVSPAPGPTPGPTSTPAPEKPARPDAPPVIESTPRPPVPPPQPPGERPRDRDRDRNREDRGRFERFEPNPKLPQEFAALYEGNPDAVPYYIIWTGQGKVSQKSDDAPEVAYPNLHQEQGLSVRVVRTRGQYRELMHGFRFDVNVLVGRSLIPELTSRRQGRFLMILAGLGVLAIGLVGDYWFSLRALRPISQMTTTAESISVKNLSERINLKTTDNELGQLAAVLNRTFDRLQAAFEQQGQFTADASHELRTPVAVILSHTELALARERSDAEYRDALAACQRAGHRMKSLIDGLLNLARHDAPQIHAITDRHPVELDSVGRESLDLLQALATERHITLQGDFQPTQILGGRSEVVQIVTNLLTNAIRYNREGGKVEIHIAPEGTEGVVRIVDTGIGIAEQDLPHVFDRFYRVDKARSRADGGTGLGLSICKSSAEALGGTISIDSKLGEGTTVVVRFPLAS